MDTTNKTLNELAMEIAKKRKEPDAPKKPKHIKRLTATLCASALLSASYLYAGMSREIERPEGSTKSPGKLANPRLL